MVAQKVCQHAGWKRHGSVVYCPDCGAFLKQVPKTTLVVDSFRKIAHLIDNYDL